MILYNIMIHKFQKNILNDQSVNNNFQSINVAVALYSFHIVYNVFNIQNDVNLKGT